MLAQMTKHVKLDTSIIYYMLNYIFILCIYTLFIIKFAACVFRIIRKEISKLAPTLQSDRFVGQDSRESTLRRNLLITGIASLNCILHVT